LRDDVITSHIAAEIDGCIKGRLDRQHDGMAIIAKSLEPLLRGIIQTASRLAATQVSIRAKQPASTPAEFGLHMDALKQAIENIDYRAVENEMYHQQRQKQRHSKPKGRNSQT